MKKAQTVHTLLADAHQHALRLVDTHVVRRFHLQHRVDPALVLLSFALLVLALLVLVMRLLLRRRPRGNAVVLVGLSDSGKTTLFQRLLRVPQLRPTMTSMKENVAPFTAGRRSLSLRLVDVPGHHRLRALRHQYVPQARAILFVLDVSTLATQYRPVSELLYEVFTDRTVQQMRVPVLLVLNKSDLTADGGAALASDAVQQTIENEINLLRETRNATVQALDDSETARTASIGIEGEQFAFEQLLNRVTLVRCSAAQNDLDAVWRWLGEF